MDSKPIKQISVKEKLAPFQEYVLKIIYENAYSIALGKGFVDLHAKTITTKHNIKSSVRGKMSVPMSPQDIATAMVAAGFGLIGDKWPQVYQGLGLPDDLNQAFYILDVHYRIKKPLTPAEWRNQWRVHVKKKREDI